MLVHRTGFTELSGGGEGPDRVNIVFVHGLRGHPQRTWEDNRGADSGAAGNADTRTATSSKGNIIKALFKSKPSTPNNGGTSEADPAKLFWPEEYLTQDIPEAKVWTYGYNADAMGGLFQANNKNSVSQHGRDLAARLEREIDNLAPILFVAHSLGGIIVKDAIRRSDACRARTKLIVFLGTPHRGSAYAGWGDIASNFARLVGQDLNKQIIKTLEVSSEVLDNIHEEFKTIVDQSRIKIHSFQEARGISDMKGLRNKVVDDFSSKLDLPPSLETVESIDANHMQMARCSAREDPQYRSILGVLKRFIHGMAPDRNERRLQDVLSTASGVEINTAPVGTGLGGAITNRPTLPCYHIPLPRNTRFVGRTSTLDTLQQKLFIRKDCQKAAIVGLGGVGKTQVALQLAHWAKTHRPEYSIFWVPTLSKATFEQAYTEMARKLPLQNISVDEGLKDSVRQYLSSEAAGPWLLVVDNADDIDTLFGSPAGSGGLNEYLPESEDGLVLFTTRSREVAVSVAGRDVVELPEMDPQEAADYLEKSLIRSSEAGMAELLEQLTYLPLAITQAAAYLNTIPQVSITEYLRLLQRTDQNTASLMSREFHDSTRYKGSQNAVATTWLVSFDQIRKSDSMAADLLSFLSCIEPKAIPQSMLPQPALEEQMVHAIGTLCGYAFVTRRGDEVAFDIHSLVHLATQIWVEREGLYAQTMEKAIRHLVLIVPSNDYTNRSLWREYLPHALRVLSGSKGIEIQERYNLYFSVGHCLQADGRFKEAMECYGECYRRSEAYFPEDHPFRLRSQHWLASTCLMDGQVERAIELLEHVVRVKRKTLTEEHPSRLVSEQELVNAYLKDGQVERAIQLIEYVTEINRKMLAEGHVSRLASEYALAVAHHEDGQIAEAMKLLEHVVTVAEKSLAEEHPGRLAPQHMLARIYLAERQIKKSVELFEHVVAIDETTLTKDHCDLLTSQHGLARAYLADGQIKKAVELFEHVVAIQKATLTKDHRNLLTSQHELARAYLADAQIKKAVELFEHVVAMRKATLTKDHCDLLTSQHGLARAYLADGQIKKAVELFEHVVAIQETTLTKDHRDQLSSQHGLAKAYLADGQIKRAVELLKYVVTTEENKLDEDDRDRLTSLLELSRAYLAQGELKKAIEMLEHVTALRDKLLTEDHPDRLASQRNLAIAYRADEQVEGAIKLLEHVVMVEGKELAKTHPDRLTSQHELARAYLANGEVKRAVETLEHVVAIRENTLDKDHPDRLASLHALAISYQANGQVKEAVELLEQVVMIRGKALAEDHPDRLASQHALSGLCRASSHRQL